MVVTQCPGTPCRVSLEDARIGETVILLNHVHLDMPGPYRAAHAIFVRQGAIQATPLPGQIPVSIGTRLLSVRSFAADGMMLDGDVVSGADVAEWLTHAFADPAIAFVDLHNAKPGCFAARVTRPT